MRLGIITTHAAVAAAVNTCKTHCPPISGDFNITAFQLYPEGFDYDSIHCKAYFGANFNATVLRVDLTTGEEELLTFPDISGNATFHISGVQFNMQTGAVYLSANNAIAFESLGLNLTGPNRLIKYNTFTDQVAYIANVDPVVKQIKELTGAEPNGFQDMAEDDAGNAYYIASYGGAIVKVTPDGTPSIFYYTTPPVIVDTPADPTTVHGGLQFYWSGIFSVGNILVLVDNSSGRIFRFDTTATKSETKYTAFLPSDMPSGFQLNCDRVYPPPMFNGTVALCSNDINGTHVLYSSDRWNSAKYLGFVRSPGVTGGIPTASAQISNSIYTNTAFFYDTGVFDRPGGNRSVFPFFDITEPVVELVLQVNTTTKAHRV